MTASLNRKLQAPSTTYPVDIFHYEQAYKLLDITPLETTELVNIVSAVLREIFKKTERVSNAAGSVFQAKEEVRMSMARYLSMVAEGFKCSQECIILAMIYIDRLTKSNIKLVIKSTNIHRLMITAIMLATKFIDDKSFKNEHYARVAGISPKEMNVMESEFLQAIGFDLYVNPILFFKYREQLIALGRPLLKS